MQLRMCHQTNNHPTKQSTKMPVSSGTTVIQISWLHE
jgi:hypothetical protein